MATAVGFPYLLGEGVGGEAPVFFRLEKPLFDIVFLALDSA